MAGELIGAMKVAASGLNVQSTRLRIISENLANANSTGKTPGADPYSRKTITFAQELVQANGANRVVVDSISQSADPFRVEKIPGHPAADADGFVKLPNVQTLVELTDMREANRSYEANLQVIKQAKDMIAMAIDLLRSGR